MSSPHLLFSAGDTVQGPDAFKAYLALPFTFGPEEWCEGVSCKDVVLINLLSGGSVFRIESASLMRALVPGKAGRLAAIE
ncbi:MAG: hypothetical protein R3F31_18835 [Verrucomicrobiales bacterium]